VGVEEEDREVVAWEADAFWCVECLEWEEEDELLD